MAAAPSPSFTELKTTVVKSLENTGVLSQIRAQLRACVYKAIERKGEAAEASCKLGHSPGATLAVRLLVEFLEFHGLLHSLSVFVAEGQLEPLVGSPKRRRRELAGAVRLGPLVTERPILEQLLELHRTEMEESASNSAAESSLPADDEVPENVMEAAPTAQDAQQDEQLKPEGNQPSGAPEPAPSSAQPVQRLFPTEPGPVAAGGSSLRAESSSPVRATVAGGHSVPGVAEQSAAVAGSTSSALAGGAALAAALRSVAVRGRDAPLGREGPMGLHLRLPPLGETLPGVAPAWPGRQPSPPRIVVHPGISPSLPKDMLGQATTASSITTTDKGLSTDTSSSSLVSAAPPSPVSSFTAAPLEGRLGDGAGLLWPNSPQGPLPPLIGTSLPSSPEGSLVGLGSLVRACKDKRVKGSLESSKRPPELVDPDILEASTRAPTPAGAYPAGASQLKTTMAVGLAPLEMARAEASDTDEEAYGEITEDVLGSSASVSSLPLGATAGIEAERAWEMPKGTKLKQSTEPVASR